ncbi:MAG: carbonic anhydrase [Turneriella sp.]|nr:carbonic anhydrase [Turneriella sp.]
MQEIWKRNIPSGTVVFFVALPLCLGIALAQGAPLLSGLISGIIGGIIVGILGASHVSVSGPAAGLTVVVIGAIAQLGSFQAFTLAVFLSGAFQIAFSLLRLGMVSKFIPGSVIRGMLAAIGIIIILKQVPHLFGYDADYVGDIDFAQRDGHNTFSELWLTFSNLNKTAILISVVSLALILSWDKYIAPRTKYLASIPGSVLAVLAGVGLNLIAAKVEWLKDLGANHLVQLPTSLGVKDFTAHFGVLNFSLLFSKQVIVIALTIAIIGSVETLLSLEAADKIDPRRRIANKNRELWAQGAGNMLAGLLGGLPITAVIVRTVTNVNSGATHRLSAIWHGLLLVVAVFLIPQVLNFIPLAALAMILALVGYKLSSYRIFITEWRSGREQFIPFIVTVIAVIFTDILFGVGIGFLVAIGFIMYGNYRKGFFTSGTDGNITIKLAGDISFIHRASLGETLRKVPNNAHVTLHSENPQDIHHDIAELIAEFREAAPLRGIQVTEKQMPYIADKKTLGSGKSPIYKRMIHGNRNWVQQTLEQDRYYFEKLARGQAPQILWIGCADSRVPPNEITETKPGEIFIHRNVANLVVHTDLNMLSVLQYAVEALKVKHVIVCGHYECGGIRAAMADVDLGLANNWLRNIKEVYNMRAVELEEIGSPKERERMMVEFNVMEQVRNLAKTSIIQKAWKKRQIEIHGWVVDLGSGYIKELPIKLDEAKDLEPIFRYKL